jgi:hypothetical protein
LADFLLTLPTLAPLPGCLLILASHSRGGAQSATPGYDLLPLRGMGSSAQRRRNSKRAGASPKHLRPSACICSYSPLLVPLCDLRDLCGKMTAGKPREVVLQPPGGRPCPIFNSLVAPLRAGASVVKREEGAGCEARATRAQPERTLSQPGVRSRHHSFTCANSDSLHTTPA